MEIAFGPLRLCSGCGGDYEDPDRTAWSRDSDDYEPDEYDPDDDLSAGPIHPREPGDAPVAPDDWIDW